jgi:hypothetical protein
MRVATWTHTCVLCGHPVEDLRFHGEEGHKPLANKERDDVPRSVESVVKAAGWR